MTESPQLTRPDLSIALDMETFQITGDLILNSRLQCWLEAARKIAPRTFEILLCSSLPLSEDAKLPNDIKAIVYPGLGYYGMKNKAAENARGRVIFFGDIDCRPEPDYLVNLLAFYDAHPEAKAVGGRTSYDGTDFQTRANSAVSWGYMHGKTELANGECYAGHNVSVRAGMFEKPFGAYTDRYGGDEYITNLVRQQGCAAAVHPALQIFHESPAHSLRGLLDRHLRELVRIAFIREGSRLTARAVLREAARSGRQRWKVFKKHAHKFDIGRRELFQGRILFYAYGAFDFAAVAVMWLFPSLFERWVSYQFGDYKTCHPVSFEPSPQPST